MDKIRLTIILSILLNLLLIPVIAQPLTKDKPNSSYAPLIWVDAGANLDRTATRPDIADILDRCVDSGFKTVILDVKPGSGLVIYPSKIAPRLLEWRGKKIDPNHDRLKIFIEEGHKRDLKIMAAFFVFSEGRHIYKVGPIYTNHPEWQAQILTKDGIKPITEVPGKTAKVNPSNPDIQKYELSIIEEVIKNYAVDGVILDGVRYDSLYTDFSDISKKEFIKYLLANGKKTDALRNWPGAIMEWGPKPADIKKGSLYDDWLLFRAKTIYDFMVKARKLVKDTNPKLAFGDYAGAWYPSYYEVGVNWGSQKYSPPKDWAPKGWGKYGYAELLDFFCAGCYFNDVTKEEALARKKPQSSEPKEAGMRNDTSWHNSVEGASEIAKEAVKGACPVYGTLYGADYINQPRQFLKALEMVKTKTDGTAIFDLCHLEGYEYWNLTRLSNRNPPLDDININLIPEANENNTIRMPTNTAEDFVVDNSDSNCKISGYWRISVSNPGYLGNNYLVHEPGVSKDFVRWTPYISLAGKYQVYVSYTSDTRRPEAASYKVVRPDKTDTVKIDQRSGGGKWVSLGTFEFPQGMASYIELTADSPQGYLIADGVRLVKNP